MEASRRLRFRIAAARTAGRFSGARMAGRLSAARIAGRLAAAALPAAVFLSAAALGPAEARTIVVALDGSGEYTSIQEAIRATHHGDVVEVGPGTYRERLAFGGRAITVRSREGPAVTVIDAEGVASVVVMDFLEGPGTVLEGFTLRNGLGTPIRSDLGTAARRARERARPASPERHARERAAQAGGSERGRFGGGILLLVASPTLRNLVVQDCRAEFGGGLYALQRSPRLEKCRFYKNSAGLGGGACLEMTEGALLAGCEFRSNLGVVGAGLALLQGSAEIAGGRFDANRGSEGGALHLLDCADPTRATRAVFFRNEAAEGPVALALGSVLAMESCTAAANGFVGAEPASIVYGSGSSGTLTRCVVAANPGGRPLGAEDADLDIRCCVLWPNSEPSDFPSGDNRWAWPGFCDVTAGDLRLRDDSPCLPEHAPPGCGLIGALPAGCSATGPRNGRGE